MFVSSLTPPQWLNLILGKIVWKNLKGKVTCGINTYSVYINKENLSWFFDLHYIFKTRGGVLRKKTSNSEVRKKMRDNYNHKYKALM